MTGLLFNRSRRAFSMIELVIVVVIIGIIAAIAIPRMSRGAAGANDSQLSANLALLRKAIDLYAAEHNGKFPEDATKLIGKTSLDGTVTGTATTDIYGPYIREIPKMNIGSLPTNTFSNTADGNGGWFYTKATGIIKANAPVADKDAAGILYTEY